ncbi:hypothetical protein RBB50_011615 [Rhinocladiella similis]
MAGFAALKPALTAQETSTAAASSSLRWVRYQFSFILSYEDEGAVINEHFTWQLINSGTLKSEPGFTPAIDAKFEFGTDHFKVTNDMKYCTIDVKAALT